MHTQSISLRYDPLQKPRLLLRACHQVGLVDWTNQGKKGYELVILVFGTFSLLQRFSKYDFSKVQEISDRHRYLKYFPEINFSRKKFISIFSRKFSGLFLNIPKFYKGFHWKTLIEFGDVSKKSGFFSTHFFRDEKNSKKKFS